MLYEVITLDAEEVVQRILRKQDQDQKIADYLTLLAAHVAMEGTFTHPVLINLLIHHASDNVPLIYGRDLSWESRITSYNVCYTKLLRSPHLLSRHRP